MNRTLSMALKAQMTDGISNFSFPQGKTSFTLTGTGGPKPGHVLATSAAEVTVTLSLTDPGWIWLYNEDPTNYVKVGFATGNYPLRVPPQVAYPIYVANGTTTLYVRADTADCGLHVLGLDE